MVLVKNHQHKLSCDNLMLVTNLLDYSIDFMHNY